MRFGTEKTLFIHSLAIQLQAGALCFWRKVKDMVRAPLLATLCVASNWLLATTQENQATHFFTMSPQYDNDLTRKDLSQLCDALHQYGIFTCTEVWQDGAAGTLFPGVADLEASLQLTAENLGIMGLSNIDWVVIKDRQMFNPSTGRVVSNIPKPYLGYFSFEENIVLFRDEQDIRESAYGSSALDQERASNLINGTVQDQSLGELVRASDMSGSTGQGQEVTAQSRSQEVNVMVQHDAPVALGALSTYAGGCKRKCRSDANYYYSATGMGVDIYVVDGVVKDHMQFKDIETGESRLSRDRFLSKSARNSDPDCAGEHGTHVAGIAAGFEYGSSKAATIVSVAVQPGCGQGGSSSELVEGLDWILRRHRSQRKQRPAVVTMSLIMDAGSDAANLVEEKVEQLLANDIVVVVAAGNYHSDACDFSPANSPGVITVGGASVFEGSERALPWSWSNFGQCVDLFAPAVDVESAFPACFECTAMYSGTSQATPHVTGLVAQYLSTSPTASPEQVRSTILASATDQLLETFRYPYEETPNLFSQSFVDLQVRKVRVVDD